MTTVQTEAFDPTQYTITIDDHPITAGTITLTGRLEFDLSDPEQTNRYNDFRLGRRISLTAYGTVTGQRNTVKTNPNGDEQVSRDILIRIDAIEP